MIFGPPEPMPEVDFSKQHLEDVLGEIKQNSRNRRIALFAPMVLAAAVLGALIAAPPQHGGLAMVADAEAPDPQLPRVFGSNGVWRLAEPIEDGPIADAGPAAVVEAPTGLDAPTFELSPPDQEDLNSLPTSTSTPPTSTSGQLPAEPSEPDPAEFGAEIRIEPAVETAAEVSIDEVVTEEGVTEEVATGDGATEEVATGDGATEEVATGDGATEEVTPEDNQTPDNVTVAENPQIEASDPAEANPSTPTADRTEAEEVPFSALATITPQPVLVYSAHVTVTVQVVDEDSSVIDWCNTRVDWGDGSVTRAVGADDDTLCTAPCEYGAASSAFNDVVEAESNPAGIDVSMQFEHEYTATIDATPRIFVATGDGCSYTLAELQLAPFTVVPLP